MGESICIVEDDEDARFLLKANLAKEGYQIELFPDGIRFIEKTKDWPSLFILDVDLPKMSGLEVCRWIKSNKETKDIPVLLVSGSPDLAHLAATEQVAGFLSKPFKVPSLLSKITRCIKNTAQRI